jgi:nicotinamide mononucleotide adenylyltransferase
MRNFAGGNMQQAENNQIQPPYETGVIHGRFQILHRDHLKYLLSGKNLCRHLVVGITNPDPFLTREDSADSGRSKADANPLTYYERLILIRKALTEAGIGLDAFTIVPFPINLPDLYQYYVPMDAVFFLSIYDDWGIRKKDTFLKNGLKIHILRNVTAEEKGISAAEVRAAMVKDRPWEHLVPASVAETLKKWNLPSRLKR